MTSAAAGQPDPAMHNARWQKMWGAGLAPGQAFDACRTSPCVQKLLDSGELDVKDKRCLVPGCGRGYDPIAFAKAGASLAAGLELAPTAVEEAKAFLAQQQLPEHEAARVSFQQGDFFEHDAEAYDLGYDYTFFCAMLPSMRQQLAQQWARVIKPGGELVTLMFPIPLEGAVDWNAGPPFPVTPDQYKEVFSAAGFELVHQQAVDEALSHPGRGGREVLGRWRRRGFE